MHPAFDDPNRPHSQALRKSFLSLFSRTALGVYIARQDKAIRCAPFHSAPFRQGH